MSEAKSKRSEAEQFSFIWQGVARIGTCMMTTTEGSRLRSRPMRGIARPEERAIFFITSRSTHKQVEIASNPHACLCFGEPSSNTYISLSGTIEVSHDADKLRELWPSTGDAYFSDGPTNPDVLLLSFTPDTAEYWDAPTNPVVIAIEFIRASVVGEKPALGDNAEVVMR